MVVPRGSHRHNAGMDHERAAEINRENWDQRAPVHLRSELYQRWVEALRAGGVTLAPPTDTEIGEVAGKRVLHLQCHIGLDTLSLARLGGEATGLDFSPASIAVARELARDLGIDARFVVGDAMRASEALPDERFDVVFASFGVFCWIPDLRRWMGSAAGMLRPGGVLYVADGHPIVDVFEDDEQSPDRIAFRNSYFRREPLEFGAGPSYADDGTGRTFPPTVEYPHPLGELVSAAADAGLKIEYLHEFPYGFFRRFRSMVEGPDGAWHFASPLGDILPMVFSMRATKV